MSIKCKNCETEIGINRRSGYCETCYKAYFIGYQTGYNQTRKNKPAETKP